MKQTDLAKLLVRLEAEVGKYQRDMEKSRKETAKWKNYVKRDVGSVKKVFAGLVGFLAGQQAASFYKNHAEGIDKLAKQSSKLNITTQSLQGLQHAWELTGVGIEVGNKALEKQTQNIAQAAKGYGTAKNALAELNLDAEQLVKLPVDQQFMRIAGAMQNVENNSDKVRLSMEIFGRQAGASLVNTLNLGVEGLQAASDEIDSFGGAISRVDAAKVEAANDEFTRVGAVLSSVGNRIAVETAPIVGGLAHEFLNAAKESGGVGNITRKAMDYVASGVGYAGNAVKGLQLIWMHLRLYVAEAVASMLGGMQSVTNSAAWVLNKFGADVAADTFKNLPQVYADAAQQMREKIQKVNDDLLKNGTPYEKVKNWVDDIRVKSEAAARESVEKNGGLGSLLLGDTNVNLPDKETQAEQKKLETVSSIRDRWRKSELDKELNFQAKIIEFQEASGKSKLKTLISEGVQLTRGASHTNKKLFKLNKAMALAEAAITLPSAVLKAVARGGGWPWGAAFGALTLANGLSQIAAIKKASFSGGESASFAGSGGGSTAVTDVTPDDITPAANDTQQTESVKGAVSIYIQGDIYELDDFESKVTKAVAKASGQNSLVIRDTGGRQMLEAV